MVVTAVAAGIGTSLIGRLVGSGVQRLGSLVFQKVMRIAKIDSVLKGVVAKNPAVQAAIDDFETVIGTRYGELTTELFLFLREVERNGIINLMVESALLTRDAGELKRVFIELHTKVVGLGKGDPEKLFDRMMSSFAITVQELTQDRILLEVIRVHRTELEARLDRVDLALVQMKSKRPTSEPPFETLRATLLKVAKGLQGTYRTIRVETNKGAC